MLNIKIEALMFSSRAQRTIVRTALLETTDLMSDRCSGCRGQEVGVVRGGGASSWEWKQAGGPSRSGRGGALPGWSLVPTVSRKGHRKSDQVWQLGEDSGGLWAAGK